MTTRAIHGLLVLSVAAALTACGPSPLQVDGFVEEDYNPPPTRTDSTPSLAQPDSVCDICRTTGD